MYTGSNMADETWVPRSNDTRIGEEGHAQARQKRGWLKRGINDVGQPYVQLTPKFVEACGLADQRWQVRRALGLGTWQKINGTDEIADAAARAGADDDAEEVQGSCEGGGR